MSASAAWARWPTCETTSTIDDCEVVALAEIRQDTAQLVAARYGIPHIYKDHEEMLAAEKLDGIVASQPFNRHALLLPEIYGKVKHVFTEKPLAVSVEAGEKLARLACDTGTVHMVGYHKRSDPAVDLRQGRDRPVEADRRNGQDEVRPHHSCPPATGSPTASPA